MEDKAADVILDRVIPGELVNGRLPCVAAFKIVSAEKLTPRQVGQYADQKEIRLTQCQLGLFGHTPENKTVSPQAPETPDIEQAIAALQVGNIITCKAIWEIASRFDLPKSTIADNCEYLKIKIRPCQLGAF